MTASTDEPVTPKKKDNAGKPNEEKINEIMADGATVVKMEVDYRQGYSSLSLNLLDIFISSETCDKKIPEAQALAAKGKLNEALKMLFTLEKQTRSGADTHSSGRVLVTIVQLYFEAKDWKQLNEKIVDLVKKRAQL